jgi:site-specific recombinase XerD
MKNKVEDSALFWNVAADYLNRYLPDIRRAGENTVLTYRNCINRYIDYLEGKKHISRKTVSFSMFAREYLKEYVTWMYAEAGLSPKTCNLRLTAVRSLLEYASEEFIDITSVFTDARTVKGVRLVQGPIEYFERNVMSALLAAPDVGKRTERRNRMLLIFLYDTAARVSEALNVRLCDLHTDASIPYVTFFGKGRKYRNVPLMTKTSEHLKKYIGEFHGLRDDIGTPLFFTVTHGILHRLSVDTPEKMLKRYAASVASYVAVPEHVHCHMIRKTRAMHLYREGVPLPHIQQLLGHETISTTSGFYAFATLDTLAKSLEKANPSESDRNWKNPILFNKLYRL